MHPSIPTPQSPCRASAVPVAIALALRPSRMCAPAAGVRFAGVSYREALGRKRGLARHSPTINPPSLTRKESRVNT